MALFKTKVTKYFSHFSHGEKQSEIQAKVEAFSNKEGKSVLNREK